MSGDGWPQVGTGGAVHGARDLSGHNGAVDRKMGAVDRGTGQYHRMMAMASAMLMGRRLAAVVGIRAGVRIVLAGARCSRHAVFSRHGFSALPNTPQSHRQV